MIKILYEDKFIIAANKPCGVLSAASETEQESVLSLIAEQRKLSEVYPINRLDRNVSGIILVAKKREFAAKFSALISERKINKEYLAVIHGVPQNLSGVYEDLLFRDSSCGKTFVVEKIRKGVKNASLEYSTQASKNSEDGILSLVRIKLHTGRTHQIRVQFSSRKNPIFGDGKYGSHTNRGEIALCSARISFKHPYTSKFTDIKILPDFEKAPWNHFCEFLNFDLFEKSVTNIKN